MSLQISKAYKAYGTTPVLIDVNIELASGKIHALLGPSGSGKSTLLHAIAGLEPLDRGKLMWDNEILQKDQKLIVPTERRDIGMVFQDFALFPHLDVTANISFGLKAGRWPRPEIALRVKELLSLLHLTGLEHHYPHELSGGQKQRVAVARALAPKPKLLLLDESLSSLDVALRRSLQTELKALFSYLNLTVILVTHDSHEAFAMADSITVLNKGQVVADGEPETLYRHPPNAVTAELTGMVNIWRGAVVQRDDRLWVHASGVELDITAQALPVGTPVELAIRPDICQIVPADHPGSLAITVDHVRYLGERYLVHAAINDSPLVFYASKIPEAITHVAIDLTRVSYYPTPVLAHHIGS